MVSLLADALAAVKRTDLLDRFVGLVAHESHRSFWWSGTSLSIKQAKLLLDSHTFRVAAPALFPVIGGLPVARLMPVDGNGDRLQLHHVGTSAVVSLLLACARTIKEFAYAHWPSRKSFTILWRARNALLSAYAANELPIAPSEHLLLNHSIELALRDRTAYVSLQEGVEHKHQQDRLDDKHASHNRKRTERHPRTEFEQLLDHQEVRRILDVVDHLVNQRSADDERLTDITLPSELADWPDLPWPAELVQLVDAVQESSK